MSRESDDAFERFPLAEWEALADRLTALGAARETEPRDGNGDADADDAETHARDSDPAVERLVLDDGRARFVVTEAGRVSGSMPLHSLSESGIEALEVARDGSALRVSEGEFEYVFRL